MRSDRRSLAEVLRDLRLPRDERRAAAAERAVERRFRRERDDPRVAERLAARREAEARRYGDPVWPNR